MNDNTPIWPNDHQILEAPEPKELINECNHILGFWVGIGDCWAVLDVAKTKDEDFRELYLEEGEIEWWPYCPLCGKENLLPNVTEENYNV